MRILTTPRFDRSFKKLHKDEKRALDAAVRSVISDSEIGELRKGDLAGVRVYKFRFNREQMLLAYAANTNQQVIILMGYPLAVRTDNGPEFTSRAFMAWATAHGVRHILIQPGRPMQNGYIESFNGKFRDECLNEQWFQTLSQARTCIAEWRRDYNEVRPHSSLGRIPPAQFAQQHRSNFNAAANTNHQVLE